MPYTYSGTFQGILGFGPLNPGYPAGVKSPDMFCRWVGPERADAGDELVLLPVGMHACVGAFVWMCALAPPAPRNCLHSVHLPCRTHWGWRWGEGKLGRAGQGGDADVISGMRPEAEGCGSRDAA